MKILHLAPSYYPAFSFGGPILSVHNINKVIAQKGHLLDVLTTNAGLNKREDVVLNRWIDLDGLKVKYKSFWGYEHYNFSIPYLRESLHIAKNYDIIHITSVWNFPAFAGSLSAIKAGKPFIISPRGELIKEAVFIKSKRVKWFYYNFIAKYYLKRAGAIHTTSEKEKKDLTDLNLDVKDYLVPNGINVSDFENLPSKGEFKSRYLKGKLGDYFLFLGRLDREKGLDILLQAYSRLVEHYSKINLVLVGPDSNGYKSKLEGMIKRLNLKENVVFTGLLSGEEKLSALVGAKALILPSYSENFGMVILEAMACGTPVIVSDKAGISEIVQKYDAGIVTQTNSESIYKSLKEIIDNFSLIGKFRRNGEKILKDFSTENSAIRMINIYEQLISESNKGG